MKHDTDTEMDLLLRRHARRDAEGVRRMPGARREGEAVRKSHLDADELSAYAEGAVPEAARSRYAAHLADCDDCRKIVTGIVISAGAEVEEKAGVVKALSEPRTSWREWLAALFAPPVLRYAVPALALASVIAIVLVVARRDRENFVAKNEQAQQTTSNVSVEREATTGTADARNTTTDNSENHGVLPTAANANAASTDKAKTGEGPVQPQPKQSDEDRVAQNVQLDGTTNDGAGAKPADAPQPAAAAPPKTSSEVNTTNDYRQDGLPTLSNVDTSAGKLKEKDENQLAAQKRRERPESESGAGATTTPGTAGGRARREEKSIGADVVGGVNESVAVNKQQNAPAARKAPQSSTRAARDAEERRDEGAETRVVAGRTFRRQGNTWVDSAYNSSRSVTKVRRGSEQYRALVGDEPIVGTVANALGGDVILVVKGRAYRLY